MIFDSTCKPLVDVPSLHNFSLFSAEQYGVYGISSDDSTQTPGCPIVMGGADQYSSFNTNFCLDSMITGAFNKLYLNAKPIVVSTKKEPTNSEKPQFSDNSQSSHASGLSSLENYCEPIDLESAKGNHSNKLSPIGSNIRETDCDFSDSSEGSSLSISLRPVKPCRVKKSSNHNREGRHCNEFSKRRGKGV